MKDVLKHTFNDNNLSLLFVLITVHLLVFFTQVATVFNDEENKKNKLKLLLKNFIIDTIIYTSGIMAFLLIGSLKMANDLFKAMGLPHEGANTLIIGIVLVKSGKTLMDVLRKRTGTGDTNDKQ